MATNAAACRDDYVGAAIVKPGVVAGVRRAHVDWLRGGPQRSQMEVMTIVRSHGSRSPLRYTVACFASHATQELLVISEKGLLERMPLLASL